MMTIRNTILCFLIGLTFVACQSSQEQSHLIEVSALTALLDAHPSMQVVDVRTPEEFNKGHIPKAKNIVYYSPDFEGLLKVQLSKNYPVLVYCKSGKRSSKSFALLNSLGYQKVYDLKGGYTAWSAANNE